MTVNLINDCVFFPHRFAWSDRPNGKRTWQTEVSETVKGAEKRSSFRAVPRRQLTCTIIADTLPERVRFEARYDAAKKSGYAAAPLHGRASFLAAAAAADADSISVNAPGWRWQAGDYICLIADDETFDVAAVTAVADDVLTLATNLNFAWANGALVWPVIFGWFKGTEKEQPLNGHLATWQITVAELTSARSVQIGETPAALPGVGTQVIGSTNTIG